MPGTTMRRLGSKLYKAVLLKAAHWSLITDRAIVEAVLDVGPRRVLDIGCGEGWLARELIKHGLEVWGIDAVPALIERARARGGGHFEVMSYEALSRGALDQHFDVVVCNFSLLGRESVVALFGAMHQLITPGGSLIVQTLHPVQASAGQPYRDGWREGSWAGCGRDFRKPAPWYFRTLESWSQLFADNRLVLKEQREPINPKTGNPASVIFRCAC